jgi:hypothetical protein
MPTIHSRVKPVIDPVRLHAKRFIHAIATAIFAVPTWERGVVYMRAQRSNYDNDARAVVVVDAARFLAAWRAGSDQEAQRSIDGWRSDSKLPWAEMGFSSGVGNPVPLATVSVGRLERSSIACVSVPNGITRTYWLFAMGAAAFPVEYRTADAAELHAIAGADGHTPIIVAELLAELPSCIGEWVQQQIVRTDPEESKAQ